MDQSAVIAFSFYSDAPALPLGESYGASTYPGGLPENFAQLRAWREGTAKTPGSTYQSRTGRLAAFVPNTEPWTELQTRNRCRPVFSPVGTGLEEVDIQSAIDFIVSTF